MTAGSACWAMPRTRPCRPWRKAPAWPSRTGLHLAGLIGRGGGHEEVFAAFAADRVVRTARVTLESRAIWENYHGDGVEREVAFQQFRERSVEDSYRCLAWLYDGFAFAD